MLPKINRLTTKEFDVVMEKGRVTHSSLFSLRSLKSEKPKISAVAPQKIVKTAVARNKLRRTIYESIRPHIEKIDSQVVVIAKQPALEASFADLSHEIKAIFVKAGLLK